MAPMARHSLSHDQLVAGVRAGNSRALARAISLVENATRGCPRARRRAVPGDGARLAIGITGPPGVGKSSLIARSFTTCAGSVEPVGSSRSTHRAVLQGRLARRPDPALGDFLDPGVFIRSMGGRGHLGGFAEATLQALLLLDAAGRDVIFLETVGTGQSDVEVAGIADAVLLVLMPGSGDSVQALKAGIMEIPT